MCISELGDLVENTSACYFMGEANDLKIIQKLFPFTLNDVDDDLAQLS